MHKFFKISFLSLMALVSFAFPHQKIQKVQAQNTFDDYYTSIEAGSTGKELWNSLSKLMGSTQTHITSYAELQTKTILTDTDPMNSDHIIALYSRQSIEGAWSEGGSLWNREHVWCQSLSGGLYGEKNAGSDIHHLRPALSLYNSQRNNTPYGEVSNKSTATQLGDTGNYSEEGLFEPRDDIKGDIARILLYVYTRYSSNLSSSSDYITDVRDNGSQLVITNIVKTSSNSEADAWNLLMKWNELDPVDYLEMYRNDAIEKIQGNRNVFIDHPEFMRMCIDNTYHGEGALLDLNNTYDPLSLNYIGVDQEEVVISRGESKQITFKTFPEISTPVIWTSDDETIAIVSSNGTIVGLKEGQTKVHVKGVNSKISHDISVYVSNENIQYYYNGYQLGGSTNYRTNRESTINFKDYSIQVQASMGSSQNGQLWLGSSSSTLSEYSNIANAIGVSSSSQGYAALLFNGNLFNISSISYEQSIKSSTSRIYFLKSEDNGHTYTKVYDASFNGSGNENTSITCNFNSIASAYYAIVVYGNDVRSRNPHVGFYCALSEVDYVNNLIQASNEFMTQEDIEYRNVLVKCAKEAISQLSKEDREKIVDEENLDKEIQTIEVSQVIESLQAAIDEFAKKREIPNDLTNIKTKVLDAESDYNKLTENDKQKVNKEISLEAIKQALAFLETWYQKVRVKEVTENGNEYSICAYINSNDTSIIEEYDSLSDETKNILKQTYDTTMQEKDITITESINYIAKTINLKEKADDNSTQQTFQMKMPTILIILSSVFGILLLLFVTLFIIFHTKKMRL